jgi:hypothetical protein
MVAFEKSIINSNAMKMILSSSYKNKKMSKGFIKIDKSQ